MKHYSGIDYEHFLNDIRDMYPFSIDEAVLVELIANFFLILIIALSILNNEGWIQLWCPINLF